MKKIEKFINNLNTSQLICPICHSNVWIIDKSLKCAQNHTFNINKKGYIRLFKSNKCYKDDTYNKSLFEARRKIILKNFYTAVHEEICKIIKKMKCKKPNIIDIGCGEGSHSNIISKNIDFNSFYLTDISSDAIELATDYLDDKLIPIVCDVYHLPFIQCFDVVLDILSPFNYKQIYNLLNENGIFIKVVPTSNYLKEIRELNNIKIYEKEDEIFNNFSSHFSIIEDKIIQQEFNISKEDSENFILMTPLTKQIKNVILSEKITISLRILVGVKNEII